jgi:thiamine-monophosphate kinase
MERELVRWLCERLPQTDRVIVGPGDDAAVLRTEPGRELVVSTDMLMDGVDFLLPECEVPLAGRKALAVNLSDLAAMGAKPLAAFISIAIPQSARMELVQSLYEGMQPLADKYGVALAGGDTNVWSGPLCINVTVLGEVAAGRALLRSGAVPGDDLLVTGTLGGSILGRHFTFEPRIAEALHLAEHYVVHAAMDISDGLSLDLSRLATASGCGVRLDLAAIPIDPAAHELAQTHPNGSTPLDHALGDGEDFELLLALPPDEAERLLREQPLAVPVTRIGRFISQPGLFAGHADGVAIPLVPRGYEHGRSRSNT